MGGGAGETRFGKIDSLVNSASMSGSRRLALRGSGGEFARSD